MKITIEIDSKSELEKLSVLLESFKIRSVRITTDASASFTKGDKRIDPKALFGIWANKPRSIEDIREGAWNRKTKTI